MNEIILAVDDETFVLNAYQRNLGDQFEIVTAESPELALEQMRSKQFAVILSDLKMPGMDGIEFLAKAKELQPDAVRIMISGHADMTDAINSVREAEIFRLLIKPCPTEELAQNLESAIKHHRLIVAEKALLEQTLNGAIHTLTDILSIMDPEAYGQAQLRSRLMRSLALHFKAEPWEFEIAALLAEIGRATLPPLLNEKIRRKEKLGEAERLLQERVPEFSAHLLAKIPRIEGAARAILYQNKNYDGSGFPLDETEGNAIPLGGRCLRSVNALMAMHRQGFKARDALTSLKMGPERYDPAVVTALFKCTDELDAARQNSGQKGPQQMLLKNLAPGMSLMADIKTAEGMVVMGSGTKLSQVTIKRIQNFAQLNPIVEPILVDFPEFDDTTIHMGNGQR
jgi:response regulator RpfG family c-di-GMP phosphodiesterase